MSGSSLIGRGPTKVAPDTNRLSATTFKSVHHSLKWSVYEGLLLVYILLQYRSTYILDNYRIIRDFIYTIKCCLHIKRCKYHSWSKRQFYTVSKRIRSADAANRATTTGFFYRQCIYNGQLAPSKTLLPIPE